MTPADIRLALRRHCCARYGSVSLASFVRLASISALSGPEARAVATWVRYGWTVQAPPTAAGLATLLEASLQLREHDALMLARSVVRQWPHRLSDAPKQRPPRRKAMVTDDKYEELVAIARRLVARRPTYCDDVGRAAGVNNYKAGRALMVLYRQGEVTRHKRVDGVEYRRVGGYDE